MADGRAYKQCRKIPTAPRRSSPAQPSHHRLAPPGTIIGGERGLSPANEALMNSRQRVLGSQPRCRCAWKVRSQPGSDPGKDGSAQMHHVSRETHGYGNTLLCEGVRVEEAAARRQPRVLVADPHGKRWQRIAVLDTSRHPGPSGTHWMRSRSRATRGIRTPAVANRGLTVSMERSEQSAAVPCTEPNPTRSP